MFSTLPKANFEFLITFILSSALVTALNLDQSKKLLSGKELTLYPRSKSKAITLYSIDTHFNTSTTAFENIGGKEEITWKKQSLLSPQCFLLILKIVSQFVNILDIISEF